EAVDAVAPALLGGDAGAVGCGQDRGDVLVLGGDRHHTDAGAEAEHPVLPREAEVAHPLAQRLGGAHRLIERGALEKNAEFVAPRRESVSRQRTLDFSSAPTCPRRASPALWPQVSFTILN